MSNENEKLTYPGGGLTTERTSVRLSKAVLNAAIRAAQKVKPTHKPHWWLSRWIEIGAQADGVKLFNVDGASGDGELLEAGDWIPCTVLASGPQHVTVGIGGRVVTVSPEQVRRSGVGA